MSLLLDYGTGGINYHGPNESETIFTSASIPLDGATRIKFELLMGITWSEAANLEIKDNGVSLGLLMSCYSRPADELHTVVYGAAFMTPDADDHVFEVIASTSSDPLAHLDGSDGWYRISEAPADELSYVERNTAFFGSNPFIESDPITLDGDTRVRVDLFAGQALVQSATAEVVLLDNGVELGTLHKVVSELDTQVTLFGSRFLTPDAGEHTFSVEVTNAEVYCDTPTRFQAFLRVTNA